MFNLKNLSHVTKRLTCNYRKKNDKKFSYKFSIEQDLEVSPKSAEANLKKRYRKNNNNSIMETNH